MKFCCVIVTLLAEFSFLYLTSACGPKCITKFDNGIGVGLLRETFKKRLYCSYLGIPYVQPPVGELRFEDPIPLYFDTSATFNNVSNPCIQVTGESARHGRTIGGEDCLYLNVYTTYVRVRTRPRPLMPVLVWIHGGSFTEGSSETDIFGADFILDEDVIAVTFNYRLASLGFMGIVDLNIASNLGLKDQTEAFRWVKRNIKSFGGDPKRVTLVGWSSGAASATYHMYTQASKGLFKHVIAMSGTMTQPWAYNFITQYCSYEYLKKIDATTKEELKARPAKLMIPFDSPRFHYLALTHLCYMPGEDSMYAPKNPYDMVRVMAPVSDVPLLIGSTAVEHDNIFNHRDFSMDQFNYPNDNATIYERIRDYLEHSRTNRSARIFYRKLGSFADFQFGQQYFIDEASRRFKSPIYRYRFSFDGPFAYAKNMYYRDAIYPMPGAMHGDDLGYLFTPYNYQSVITSNGINEPLVKKALKVQRRMVRLWTNFIKYGFLTQHPRRD
ncbi:venom carboxylesterase-6-like isoform X2 [Ochlerotatus camptorhynchus]|uniref:venom carboxylesterase-6-like isoform X2 n=1 Tax=Ochlerotatus camptorhynchus TaxID=644619 RepID=UPI0031E0CFD3